MCTKNIHYDIAVYAGFLENEQSLLKSASGGIATALAEAFIRQGGYVAGVTYSDDFYEAEYVIVNKVEELDRLKGSKYIEVNKKEIYSDVQRLLEKGERVLFFGLPCVVAAMDTLCKQYRDSLILCELVCHGPTSARVHKEYIMYLENKYKSQIKNFSVRYKKRGWMPPYVHAEFENQKIFEREFYQTEYGKAFAIMGRESCYNCRFKGVNRKGDIMLGDYRGASKQDVFWNQNGVSVLFVETTRGNQLVKEMSGVTLFSTDFFSAVAGNPMVVQSKMKDKRRERFIRIFNRKGLLAAVRETTTVMERVKSIIPYQVKMVIKKLVLYN